MNIILDRLPCELGGTPINTDFRVWILFEQLMLDGAVPPAEKGYRAIRLVYKAPPADLSEAWGRLLWFFRCGKEPDRRRRGAGAKHGRVYDFDVDAERIYASFYSTYHIDLNSIPALHWWKFRAMFDALPEDSAFGRAVYWRMLDTSELKGKTRQNAEKMKKQFAIRDKALDDLNREVAECLARGQDPAHLLKSR